jgi:EAL domain-containing protein (putative c-di-GMP-specific phosphodiesterase class I)/FixJ family two-component response regulator
MEPIQRTRAIRALVIDDEPLIRGVVSAQLRHLGVGCVQTAADGAEAMQLLESAETPVDVALCDLGMPNEDGLVFLRRVAASRQPPAVILMSGDDPLVLDAARRLGIGHNLDILGVAAKPFTCATLAALLDGLDRSLPAAPSSNSQRLGVADITRALRERLLEVWFQPQMDLASHEILGVEALVRLRHWDYGLMAPITFLGPAEEHGLMEPLTDYVIEESVAWCQKWKHAGHPLTVSINLCATALNDLTFPDRVAGICRRYAVTPGDLAFELTESWLAKDSAVILDIMTRLRLKGFRLSIDDFGTGYSSLEQLKALPFHELKVDRRFVQDATHDARSCLILQSSLDLAAQLQISTVAEGVESEPELDLVSRLGCHLAQGFLIARPMPPAEIPCWLAGRTSSSWRTGAARLEKELTN